MHIIYRCRYHTVNTRTIVQNDGMKDIGVSRQNSKGKIQLDCMHQICHIQARLLHIMVGWMVCLKDWRKWKINGNNNNNNNNGIQQIYSCESRCTHFKAIVGLGVQVRHWKNTAHLRTHTIRITFTRFSIPPGRSFFLCVSFFMVCSMFGDIVAVVHLTYFRGKLSAVKQTIFHISCCWCCRVFVICDTFYNQIL